MRDSSSRALEALFPGHRGALLTAIYLEPGRWWRLNELADYVELPPASLQAELDVLHGGGVLLKCGQEGQLSFCANPECPFFAEIQGIVAKCASLKGPRGAETILVVDDEPATLKISRILLESWGYQVFEAREPGEAIRIFEQHKEAIRLLLTDVVMPGMTGPELVEKLREANHGLRVLYMSGYYNDELIRKHVAFLPKPFSPASLARKIREELDKL